MALLLTESWDHYSISTANLTGFGKWSSTSGTVQVQNITPRTGAGALRGTTSPTLTSKIFSTSGGAIVGIAVNWSTSIGPATLIQVLEGAIVHTQVSITAGGLLTVGRSGTVLATGTTVLTTGNWYYIELKTVIHDTTGTTEVRIDGVAEPNLTLTGQDTRNAGTGVWDRILFAFINGGNTHCDDIYISDTSGSAPRNDFLGAVKIECLLPQTDAVSAGSNAGLTCSTGTDHGALVDEYPANTTDYNSSPTVGLKDTYQFPSMTLTGTVYGVQTNLYVSKSDAAVRAVCPVLRTASVDNDGTNVSPTTTFAGYVQMWQQDPNAGSPIEWTTGNIASLQVGMKVTV